MSKKVKNGSGSSSARVKVAPKKRMTKKDLEDAKVIEDEYRKLNEFVNRGI